MTPALHYIRSVMIERWFLLSLFVINLIGTIYGYYWYKEQLMMTKWYQIPFVPDSPTASLFFTVVLFLYLMKKRSPLIEALACVTLFKYGIWAVVMIVWGAAVAPIPWTESLTWEHWMLIGSHLGMALQGILYFPYYTFQKRDILITATWTLLNDYFDYQFDLHPWVVTELDRYIPSVAFFTVVLGLTSVFLAAIFMMIPSKVRLWEYKRLYQK
ncbi:putative membrane protein YpjA [Croceifilum oryzae]|uniref:Membrane protein YpjA n=1 Tax=Croceifilum oryzae TaxID=1553429 RepID=A0AAJ1TGQ1_9BACL|nr:DUF1405 domain-containing protein [Croceifilum oryzae]MDQ0418565.1 putative membrane protein YpjA [Croceifilum oryzae]